ncbi:MAG: preprotein translocase subunit SecG [Bacteroidota bacterium]|jgi:preprotein translocase subunit SecG
MTIILTVLIFIVSLLLTVIVLIQNSKGGGLDTTIASKNQVLGAGKTTEVVEKITWWLAGILILLAVISTKMVSTQLEDEDLGEGIENVDSTETEGEEEEQN